MRDDLLDEGYLAGVQRLVVDEFRKRGKSGLMIHFGDFAYQQAEGRVAESFFVVFAAAEFLRKDAFQFLVVLSGQRNIVRQVMNGQGIFVLLNVAVNFHFVAFKGVVGGQGRSLGRLQHGVGQNGDDVLSFAAFIQKADERAKFPPDMFQLADVCFLPEVRVGDLPYQRQFFRDLRYAGLFFKESDRLDQLSQIVLDARAFIQRIQDESVDEIIEAQRHVVGIIEMHQRGDVFRQLLLIQLGKAGKRFRLFELLHMPQGETDMKELRVEGGNQLAAVFGQFPAPELINLVGFRCVLKRRDQPDALSENVFRKRDRDFSLLCVFDLSEELEIAAVVENEETFFAGVLRAFYKVGAGQLRAETCSASDHLPEFGF